MKPINRKRKEGILLKVHKSYSIIREIPVQTSSPVVTLTL